MVLVCQKSRRVRIRMKMGPWMWLFRRGRIWNHVPRRLVSRRGQSLSEGGCEARRGQFCEGAGVPRGSRKQDTEQQAHVREKPSANVDLNQERTF